ncbi:alcohol acetyltransferase-domain-containing protein [Mucidula mucida]|nr:alcohol acetyltransferase-domain-containing protein [Mucidula mucida]
MSLRKAGLLEQFHATRHNLNLDSCVVCAAEYVHKGPLLLSKQVLYPALKQVVQSHAALGVYFVDESINSSTFHKLDQINLDDVVEFVAARDIADVLKEQFATPFDTQAKLPLWRIIVLDERMVVFAFHHGIGDGLSGLAFHKTLSRFLALSSAEDDPTPLVIPSVSPLSDPIDKLVNLSPPLLTVLWEICKLIIPVAWTSGASAWTGAPIGTKPSPAADVRIIRFSVAEASRFHAACRSNQATVTSAVFTLAVAAVSQVIGPTEFKTLSTTIPISLRPLSNTPSDVFCDQVSAYLHYPPLTPSFSWDDASHCASELRRQRSVCPAVIGLLKYLNGNYAGYFTGKYGGKRAGSFEVSNPGLFDRGEDGPWAIESMWFAQCDAYVGSALKLNVVGLSKGGLTITVTSGKEALEPGVLDRFVEGFTELFYTLI